MKLGKKLLSLLTVLCLTLSLFPTMALADSDVSVGDTPNREISVTVGSATLNSNTPYLVEGKTVAQQTITSEEGSQGYIHFTSDGQITLNNYTGSSKISIAGNLTINWVGINTITTSGANSIYSTGALTITGDSNSSLTAENPTSGSAQTTIYSTSNITITGNTTVTAKTSGTAQAINSESQSGKITIAENATVTAINSNSTSGTKIAVLAGNGTSNPTGTIEVTGSATLTAQGYGKALACKSMSETSSPKGFTYPDGSTIKVSKNYDGSNPETTYAEGSLGSYKYVEVTHAVVNYDVWVGGTQVTSANKDNVLGVINANGTPTVTYTPASSSSGVTTPQKLTLNGAVIESGSEKGIEASDNLVIDLKGENQITGFYPGAMSQPATYTFPNLDPAKDWAIVSPGSVDDMRRLPGFFREKGVRYIFDPGQQLPVLSGDDLCDAIRGSYACVTNDYELGMVCKKTGKSEEELVAMTGWLVTTLGGDGQRIRNAQGVDVHVPAIPCDGVKDPTGAGDSHRAGLLKGLVCGLEMPEAAKLGAVSACYAIEQLGTQEHLFSKDEFRKRYEASFGPLPITL